MAERDFSAGCYVVEINGLFTLFVRISVVENPLVARQLCAMAVLWHNVFANYLNLSSRAVLVEIECVFV